MKKIIVGVIAALSVTVAASAISTSGDERCQYCDGRGWNECTMCDGRDGVTVLCVVEMGISLRETEQKKLVQVVKERRFSNVAIVNEDNANVMHVSERGEKDISEDNSFLFRG